MKMFAALVMFVTVHSFAFAEGVTGLNKGDVSISQARAEIISVKEICPSHPDRPSCRAIGSTVKVKVYLKGCLDRFGGYVSKFEILDNHKAVLHFAALNIFNEASRRARCVTAPIEIVTLHTSFEGEIELQELEYAGNILPQY